MRPDRVISKQNIIINVSIEFILGIVRMLINQFAFQRIEIPFHRSIIIRTAALSDIMIFTILSTFL